VYGLVEDDATQVVVELDGREDEALVGENAYLVAIHDGEVGAAGIAAVRLTLRGGESRRVEIS
jgi:hypothetical protein